MKCQEIAEASGECAGEHAGKHAGEHANEREIIERLLKPLRLTANAAFNRHLLH